MNNFISNEIKRDIIINYVEPSYKNDVIRAIKLRKVFKKSGLLFEVFSKLFVGVTTVLSFSTGIYMYRYLSFLSGTSSVISLVLLQYSSYSYRESKKLNNEITDLLKKLHIDYPGSIEIIDSCSSNGSMDDIPLVKYVK